MDLNFFYMYKVAGELLPAYPIYVLFFQYKGLSLASISWLLIIWSIPGLILEIPSSILADRWNRRYLLITGRVFRGLCFVIWSLSGNFFGFAMGFLLWGIGGTLSSGTEEAWLYDCLETKSREGEFDRIWGKCVFYSQLSVGIAGVIGSFIAVYSMTLTMWISVCVIAVSTIFAIILKEYNNTERHRSDPVMQPVPRQEGFSKYRVYFVEAFSTFQDGMKFCFTYKFIPVMIGFFVTVLVTAGVLDEYDQLIIRSMGLPLGLVGLWSFLRYGMEALGGYVAWRLKKIFLFFGISNPFSMQLWLAVIAGILLLFTAGFPIIFLLPLYGSYYFLMSCARVLFTDSLQKNIGDQGRATVQSLAMMLEAPGGILICAIFGIAGESDHLHKAMAVIAIWILVLCPLFWMIHKKRYVEIG